MSSIDVRLFKVFWLALPFPVFGQWAVLDAPDLTADPGWWEDPVEAVAMTEGWASVWNIYDSTGTSHPWAWRVDGGEGNWHPLLTSVEGTAAGLVAFGNGYVTASTSFSSSDSTGVEAIGYVQGWSGAPLLEEGLELSFLSSYSELHGIGSDGNRIAVVGMGLDPCCVHRELPVVALFEANGAFVSEFGGGKIAVDIGIPMIVDTLNIHSPNSENAFSDGMRHNEGGTFHAVAFDGNDLVLGGAYANAMHLEVMLVRMTMNGQLVANFGDGGWVHWNIDPGNNTWVESLVVLPNGNIQCLVGAHLTGDLEPAFHVLTLDAMGQPLDLVSSPGSLASDPKGMDWGDGAWTAWGASASEAVVGRWNAGGEVTSQNLPGASAWQAARGAWNGSAMAVFGRATTAQGAPVARMRVWQTQPPATITPQLREYRCSAIHPNPCPVGTIPSIPFSAGTWYDCIGRACRAAPTAPGSFVFRSDTGQTCPVIFQ